jgi:uncharacterized Fe-S cluster-containing radical SAM superfamily protein
VTILLKLLEGRDVSDAVRSWNGGPASTSNTCERKFTNPGWTAKGEVRAAVTPTGFTTLWFNTGTLCNLTCAGCYIESSPRNDRLAYLTPDDVRQYLDEVLRDHPGVAEIGFTGGEPFMNPDIVEILEATLGAGFRVLVLTNAMLPMGHRQASLLQLQARYPHKLALRVSLDDYSREGHERVRGPNSWAPAISGLQWLSQNGFDLAVAARIFNRTDEDAMRRDFATLFSAYDIRVEAGDPHRLVLFPEMDNAADVPEISEHCWGILGRSPSDIMCATSRMVVKRKGADRPVVVSCTLLPYDQKFEMGHSLAEANRPVQLNHPYCSKFCVLGGASCSR